jgi:patatin-like phospholipase/acyl hydrolase
MRGIKVRRILSIDGGDLKGVFPESSLTAVEEATGKLATDYFGLIAGTSTSGIITLGLSAREIRDLYVDRGPLEHALRSAKAPQMAAVPHEEVVACHE